jgi:putative aminopeptidase FrvX
VSDRDAVFGLVSELALLPAPSGREEAVDAWLQARLGTALRADAAGNRVLSLRGRGERARVAIAAHKDEIGAIVKRVEEDGRLRLWGVGDAHPWIWGETPLELLGERERVAGVLSFGSRHVSPESPQREQVEQGGPVRWRDVWVETKRSAAELAEAGVRPGTRAVLGAARRAPVRLGSGGSHVAAPALDDTVALAALVLLAETLGEPAGDVDLVFTTREEVGCQGALFYAREAAPSALVALEVAPVAAEYGTPDDARPVLIEADSYAVLSADLGAELSRAATAAGLELGHVVLDRYGCDASKTYAAGLVGRAAALAMQTDNTHGCEIVHLDAIDASVRVLARWLA